MSEMVPKNELKPGQEAMTFCGRCDREFSIEFIASIEGTTATATATVDYCPFCRFSIPISHIAVKDTCTPQPKPFTAKELHSMAYGIDTWWERESGFVKSKWQHLANAINERMGV